MYNSIGHSTNTNHEIDVPEATVPPFYVDPDEDNSEHGPSSSQTSGGPCDDALQISRRLLYLTHFFALFSEDYWQFSVVIFLSAISDFKSILYVSTFGLSLNAGSIVFTPYLGNWIDQRPAGDRLRITQLLLASKHITVILLAVLSSWILGITLPLLQSENDVADDGVAKLSFASMEILVGIHVFGTMAGILDKIFTIIIERDLMVVLSECAGGEENSQSIWLSKTNATIEQISLVAKVMISFLIFQENFQYTCLVIGVISALAWAIEHTCITRIFRMIPMLEQQKDDFSFVDSVNLTGSVRSEREHHIEEDISTQRNQWPIRIYIEQPGAPAGISFALLFSNCVTFGNGMLSAYLLNRSIKARTIGVLRGVSAAVGLMGTFVYTISLRLLSLETTGLWGVASQATSLGMATVFLSLDRTEGSATNDICLYLFIASVISSRLGLWVFDVTVTQLQQQETPEKYRCLVGSVQEALNSLFNIVANVIGLLFTHPGDFIYISACGFISVALAFLFFFFGIFIPRRNARMNVVKEFQPENSMELSIRSLT